MLLAFKKHIVLLLMLILPMQVMASVGVRACDFLMPSSSVTATSHCAQMSVLVQDAQTKHVDHTNDQPASLMPACAMCVMMFAGVVSPLFSSLFIKPTSSFVSVIDVVYVSYIPDGILRPPQLA